MSDPAILAALLSEVRACRICAEHLPPDRLTLLVGGYAQKTYAAALGRLSMTDLVRRRGALGPDLIALPHPAWRSTPWMRKNPWFEEEILPPLRAAITARLSGA